MIRKVVDTDIINVSILMYQMYKEVFPKDYTDDMKVYVSYVVECLNDPTINMYIDTQLRGYLLVKDVSEPMTPTLIRIDANKIYITPDARNGRVLQEFYGTIFREYPDGDILGVTEIDSKHIPVLEKRHTRIANVYKLNRS